MKKSIVIVGAGPAGTATALSLILTGIPASEILLIDRKAFPRDKLCGGAITNRGWGFLNKWDVKIKHIFESDGIYFVSNGKGQHIREPGTLATVDRYELDFAMLEKAKEAGAEFHVANIKSLEEVKNGWKIICDDLVIEADYLIGADGVSSHVRRTLGLEKTKLGHLLEVAVECPEPKPMPKLFEMDFSVALKGVEGYCWEFPFVSSKDNKTYIKYGIMDKLGSVSTEQLKTLLYEYMKEKAIDEKPKTEGYPERYFTKMPKFIFKRAVLVGDANGVDPWLGEGLAVAFEQAEYASNIIANAFKSKANLATWKNYLFPLSFYGRNHCVLNIIANRVYGSHRKFWIKQITQNKKLAKLTYQKSFKGYGRFFKSLWRVFFLGRHYLQK